jgi:hypothetical protein
MNNARQREHRHLRSWRRGLAGIATMLLLCASLPAGAAALADREFDQAVQSFRSGRVSEAFGQFVDLANRGDVDSARIALFMSAYGAPLYGKHWDVLQSDTAYWTKLVRNSGTSARAQPDFIPLAAAPARKGRTQAARPSALRSVSTATR